MARGRKRKVAAKRQALPPSAELKEDVPPARPKRRGRKRKEPADAAALDEEPSTSAMATRRKRARVVKPMVKDLAVSLGLDKGPSRLSKAKKTECKEEDLEEERFQEEMHNLNKLEEVLKESQMEAGFEESDKEEGGEEDDGSGLELSDEEGDSLEPHCPKPLPKRGKGSRKERIQGTVASEEEVKEMCMMITQSTRKSLITKRPIPPPTPTVAAEGIAPEENQCMELVPFDPNITIKRPVEEDSAVPIIYNCLRRTLRQQEEWYQQQRQRFEEQSSSGSTTTTTVDLLQHAKPKGSIRSQLYFEHLSWLSIEGHKFQLDEDPIITINGQLAWFSEFQAMCKDMHPALAEDSIPDSFSTTDMMLKAVTVRATRRITNVIQQMLHAREAQKNLIDHLTKAYYEKKAICTEFEMVHEALNLRSVRLDESSVWGLKPIKLALEPPYFKSKDGLMAYPTTPDAGYRNANFSQCFFKRDKQKWTTKDLQQLKVCIKDVLLSRRLLALNDRYSLLLSDCRRRYEMEMIEREEEYPHDFAAAEEVVANKKRGRRPRRSLMTISQSYGNIYPALCALPNGIVVRYQLSPRTLADWRLNEERILKTKTYEELVLMENESVDWPAVANKMVVKSRKHRTAEDCELAWRHEVHPRVNDKRWGVDESRRLREIYGRLGNDWETVAMELNQVSDEMNRPGRTQYQCFFRVRNRLDPPKKLSWTKELDGQVLSKLKERPGNWRLVAASVQDACATKRQVIERYKKTINPVLRNGAFTRVEDCLLILTIEKLKPFLAREGHFGCLLSYLPWRCETTWRDRANNLFSDWIVPWTLEEDKMLLQLAKTMNRNWQKISEEFTSFKNRKGCLTRYKILMRRLKDPRFNNSLEAYHEAYAMTRYNVFQYKHLKEILELLQKVRDNPLPPEYMNFPGLLRDQEPSEVRLQHMLLTFDRTILHQAIASLTRYVKTRDNYWRNWISKHGKRKRTFDRRTFHPENPQSVASALHIRGLDLKPKGEVENLSDFEIEVYKFYGRFKRTKALKEGAERPYIPDAKTLAQWYAVSRLIATQVDQLEDVPIKRKWKSLKTEEEEERSALAAQKLQILVRIQNKNRRLVPPKASKLAKIARRTVTKKAKTLTKKRQKVPMPKKVVPVTNEEGYLLIPEEPPMQSVKRGRKGRPAKKEDEDFAVPDDKMGNEELIRTSEGDGQPRRRSARIPKPKKSVVPVVEEFVEDFEDDAMEMEDDENEEYDEEDNCRDA